MLDIKLANLYQESIHAKRASAALTFTPEANILFKDIEINSDITITGNPHIEKLQKAGLPEDKGFLEVAFAFSLTAYADTTKAKNAVAFSQEAIYKALLTTDLATEKAVFSHQQEIADYIVSSIHPLAFTQWRLALRNSCIECGVPIVHLAPNPPDTVFN